MSKYQISNIACLFFVFSFFIPSPLILPSVVYGQSTLGNLVSSLVPGAEKGGLTENATIHAQLDINNGLTDGAADTNGNRKIREEEQNIMEEALTLLEESEEYWKKGDLENALELLDEAYALIIETDDDPAIARQKDDLRLLISKRILAIYSSKQTTTVGVRSEIPMTMNADVEKEIRSFQSFERDFFVAAYQRSGLHRPMILKELKKAGLPEELSWLPLVESGFKISALSKARALGLWQFIPSTGFKYGLNRSDWIDERMDAQKSTRAAIGYLKDLHAMFGDWMTVLAAYNCGEYRVLRVISGQHMNYLDRFWDLYHQLPYETARYVPRFLATLHIIKDPAKYGMDLGQPREKELPFEIVKTRKNMKLQDIAKGLEIPEDTLIGLNPELRHKMTPDREYDLKVPLEAADKFAKVADSIPEGEKPKLVVRTAAGKSGFKRHKVKRGETKASIARRYGIPVGALMACNNLSGKRSLRVGQSLKVPARSVKASSGKPSDRDSKVAVNNGAQIIRYKVKKGDSLSSLAQRFKTTPSEIKKQNRIRGNKIQTGQIIRIGGQAETSEAEPDRREDSGKKTNQSPKVAQTGTAGESAGSMVYKVKKGDSLDRIAKRNNISLARLIELNNLDRSGNIQPGQAIILK